jgi:hypothetical protein
MARVSQWTPEAEADLIHRRDVLRQKWPDIAHGMGKSLRNIERRYHEMKAAEPKPRRAPLHEELGIATHVHRQAILDGYRKGMWDHQTDVGSHNHLYRESITLAGASS